MNKNGFKELFQAIELQQYSKLREVGFGKRRITILCYHEIGNADFEHGISVKSFREQMEFIKKNYEIVRLKNLFDDIIKIKGKKRMVIVTFDDAFQSFFLNAYPILKKLKIPSTVFVPTAFIGKWNQWDVNTNGFVKCQIMNASQLQTLSKSSLVDFGSHSIDHVRMGKLTDNEIKRQVRLSKSEIENLIGVSVDMFAYPYGQLSDISSSCYRILESEGYKIAVTTRWGTLNSFSDRFKLKRIFLKDNDTRANIRKKIEGYYDWYEIKEFVGYIFRQKLGRFKKTVRRKFKPLTIDQ